MTSDGDLVISEVFGPTFQGEGPTLGRRAAFVRLGRCNLDCTWCFAPETPVLMADWTWRPVGAIEVGDVLVGRTLPDVDRQGRLVPTDVVAVSRHTAGTVVVDGELRCTPDHRFWVAGGRHHRCGWCEVQRCAGVPVSFVCEPSAGDEAAWGRGRRAAMGAADALDDILAGDLECESWAWGYLGGLLDAEGSASGVAIRVSLRPSADPGTAKRIASVLDRLGLEYTLDDTGFCLSARGGTRYRILTNARPANPSLAASGYGRSPADDRIISTVEPGGTSEVVTLTTDVGSFVAGGYVVKNCDTPYTWDWERYDPSVELSRRTVDDVVAEIAAMRVDRVVVTGGEPLLQQRRLVPFLEACAARGWAVEVETNGTLAPASAVAALVEQFNVSPKLANSGVDGERRIVPSALAALAATGKAVFKFVVTGPADLDEIAALGVEPVHVMAEGTTADAVLATTRAVADDVAARGWHLTTRLHVLLWGDERGR